MDGALEDCWLSPISIWEFGLLHARGRVVVEGGVHEWVRRSQSVLPWREASVNVEVALTSLRIELPGRDPADRFLAATALTYELELATLDADLVAAEWLPTVSG